MILTLWVDPQNDFVDPVKGALGVKGGPQRIPAMNQHMMDHREERIYVASRDQHTPQTDPAHQEQYGVHCQVGSWGAQWHHRFNHNYLDYVINKGSTKADPSPWDGITQDGLTLDELCLKHEVTAIEIGGFVAEVCVRAAWCDAIERRYDTTLLMGTVAAIDPRDGMRDSLLEAINAGVYIG